MIRFLCRLIGLAPYSYSNLTVLREVNGAIQADMRFVWKSWATDEDKEEEYRFQAECVREQLGRGPVTVIDITTVYEEPE